MTCSPFTGEGETSPLFPGTKAGAGDSIPRATTKGKAMTALYKVEGDHLKMVWSYAVHIGQWRKLQDGPNVFYMEFDRER